MNAGFGTDRPLAALPVIFSRYFPADAKQPMIVDGFVVCRDAEQLQAFLDNDLLRSMGVAPL